MQELTRDEQLEIEINALRYTKSVISTDVATNARTIEALKIRVLTLEKKLEKLKTK